MTEPATTAPPVPESRATKAIKMGKLQALLAEEVAAVKDSEARYAANNPPAPVVVDGKEQPGKPRIFHAGQVDKLVRASLASKTAQILDLCTEAVIEVLAPPANE